MFQRRTNFEKSPGISKGLGHFKQSSVIYWFKCDKTECNDEYIVESFRTFEERYKEHLKVPSSIFEHQMTTGHVTTVNNFKMLGSGGTIWLEP